MTRHLLALNHFANSLDAPGGTRLVELTSRLDGWDTTVVAASRNLFTGRAEPAGGPRWRGVWTTPYDSNGWPRIINWASFGVGATLVGLRAGRPDVVLASSPHLLTGLAGWAVARVRRVPFVLEVRDLWPQILADTGRLDADSRGYRAIAAIESFLYARADAVIVLAEGVGRAIEAKGVPAERLVFIPNGADPEDFTPSADRDALRARYAFDGLTVVYAGAHGPANGLDFVVDAAAELAADAATGRGPEVTFVLVGDGIDKARLVDRVGREGLGNVRFMAPVPKREIPDLLAAADAGLHVLADLPLFRYGVSPNKLFDYMAAGRPVLTNTAGEVGDLVRDEDAGVAVAPDGLADGVRALAAAGPEGRATWGANGRAFMAAHRSRSAMAARLAALLDRLAPAPAPGR